MEISLLVPQNIFELSKKQIQEVVKVITEEEVNNPVSDPIKIYLAAKKAGEFFKNIEDQFKEPAYKEADKTGEKSFKKYGSNIDVTSVYTSYDFSVCGDEEYNELKSQFEVIQGKLKDREKFLKGITKPTPIVAESGELIVLQPPFIKKTDGLKITY